MKVTVGQIIVLFAAFISMMQKENLMDADGNVPQPMNVESIGKVAVDFEQLLKAKGVVVNVKVDNIINLVPLLLAAVN